VKRVSSRSVYDGKVLSLRIDEFRHADGELVTREVVGHPGSVAIVAHDEDHVYLVRQPREAVGEESLLELPAGKLDVEGETPLECARRELVEEVGLVAREWRELKRFYATPGFAEEEVTLFLATGLERREPEPAPGERIEIVDWPVAELDAAIAACADASSLIGMLILSDLLR
jgi:8-oxo-dGTP pyrophosphatase MutT (NUDIX family)